MRIASGRGVVSKQDVAVDLGAADDLADVDVLVHGVRGGDAAGSEHQGGGAVRYPGGIRAIGNARELDLRAGMPTADIEYLLAEVATA